MIKTHFLYTSEVDDVDFAVSEIRRQLAELPLLKNSVGIVTCHYDYVNDGIIAAVADLLDFPLIGITTFYQTTAEMSGLFGLNITVLTSDDVRFALAHDNGVDDTPERRVANAYNTALTSYNEAPSMIMSFLSLNCPISGDEYLRCLDVLSGGVPSFGAVTTGDDESGENIFLICGDEIYTQGFALLMMIGEVNAKYYFGHFLDSSLLAMSATVTQSEGGALKKLNGQPAVEFLRKNGVLLNDENRDTVSTIPYLVRIPNDSQMIARTLARFDAEGTMHFMGDVPENSLFKIGTVSTEDILKVSRSITKQAVRENPDAALLMLFSCVGRYVTLGLDSTAEMDYVQQAIPENMNFLASYCAGEICPVLNDGVYENRYHNSSVVVCVLN